MTEPRSDAPILVINLGWEQRRLVDLAFETGHPVVGVHADRDEVPDLPFSRIEICDVRDLNAILRVAREVRPRAVVADQCDYSHFAMAMVCEELSLPGPRVRDGQAGCNKHLSRQRTAGRVRAPEFVLCADLEDATSAMEELDGPVVVKPVDNRGSFGVNVVHDAGELPLAVSEAVANAHSRLFLVEQFIEGTSIIIEGYAFDSGYRALALGRKTHIPHRPQIHLDVEFPADLSSPVYQRALHDNARVVDAVGFSHGMTSAEYIIDGHGDSWLVEIANRGAGVCISSVIVPWVSGIDTTRQLVLDALGIERDLAAESSAARKSAYLGYFVFDPGLLASVEGLDTLESTDGVLMSKYWGPTEGQIEWPDNALGRQGFVIAGGESPEEARLDASVARNKVKVRYV